MAGNFEKFKDRNPKICAAGKPSGDPHERLYKCLQSYTIESKLEALKHEAGIYTDKEFTYKLPLLENIRSPGVYTKVGDLINPAEKTKFEHLIDELRETSYNSFWYSPVGKSRDPRPGLPFGLNTKEYTFGKKSKIETSVQELVNPQISYSEVFDKADIGHDLYRLSHNDYNPSEQIDRNYEKPAFNRDFCFGKRRFYDKRGRFVRNCLNWFNNAPETIINSIQVDSEKQNHYQLGQCRTPNGILNVVPSGHTFGKYFKPDLYGLGELLRDCKPNLFKKQLQLWMANINKLRNILKHRHDPVFDFFEFYNVLKYKDKSGSKWLKKDEVYEVCKIFRVSFSLCTIEPLMEYIGVMKDGYINYETFVNMINSQKLFPNLPKLEDVPPENQHYKSSYYSAINEDYKEVDNSVRPVAGIRSIRSDLAHPVIRYPYCCAADKENLGDESTALACVNPSICTIYKLSHRDFYKPRSKEEIRNIFESVEIKLTDSEFENIWNIASEKEPHKLVCIETFKNALNDKK